MATVLLFATRVTAGAELPGVGPVTVVWPDDDCPHAANAENAAHPSAQRTRRDTLTTLIMMYLPNDRHGRRLPVHYLTARSSHPRCPYLVGFFAYANMSQFANVSPICGICALFKVLMVKYRAKRNHRL